MQTGFENSLSVVWSLVSYRKVPITSLVVSVRHKAVPKSASLTDPQVLARMLDGFTSR